jgi:AraC-like DNA-binding protein
MSPDEPPVNEMVVAVPHPALRPYVASYHGYRMEGFAPGVHAGLPSRTVTMVVSLGAPVDVCLMADPAEAPRAFEALIGGLHTAPVGIRHDGDQHGVQLEITPAGARALFGCPAAELVRSVVSADEVLGRSAVSLPDRLAAATGWPERFAALDDALLGWLRDDGTGPEVEVARAWEVLCRTDGVADVASLAAEVGWSRRHLGARFRREFGLPPKVLARVMRFERAKRLMVADAAPVLADVAARAGYADQAHFTREWRSLAGSTPAAWLRGEEFPFVQDHALVDVRP